MNYIATSANNSNASIGVASTAILPANNSRIGLTLSNISDTDIYIAFGADAVVGSGTYLKAGGGSLILDNTLMCTLAINGISASASKSVTFTEFLNKIN